MKTFITSDIHLNHANILTYCGNRGTTITEMNELIISNWNSMITPEDEVYILGDVAMGQIVLAPALVRRLNGKKMLVAGNHDKTLTKKIREGDPDFVGLFDWVRDYNEVGYKHSVTGKKHMLIMSHFPFRMWNGMNQGAMMLYGHLHGSPCDVPGRIKDVGMDTNNMMPYLLDAVIDELLPITEFGNHH